MSAIRGRGFACRVEPSRPVAQLPSNEGRPAQGCSPAGGLAPSASRPLLRCWARWYLPLYRSSSCDVWLLAWERGQDTDWHDHGGSSGSFAVAEGCLAEQYRAAGARRIARRNVPASEAVAFGPAHVHDVAHGGGGPATSIHAYSPPLAAMTCYSATGGGLI